MRTSARDVLIVWHRLAPAACVGEVDEAGPLATEGWVERGLLRTAKEELLQEEERSEVRGVEKGFKNPWCVNGSRLAEELFFLRDQVY